jgi:ribosomal protein L3 glutamine methyltransferase
MKDTVIPAARARPTRISNKSRDRAFMARLSHTKPGAVGAGQPAPATVGEAIDACERALLRARVYFGHGTDNARDEAAELVFFAARLAHALGAGAYGRRLALAQRRRIQTLLQRRIAERRPLPYLTRRAFFAGLELYVDERVLVPRSPIAELALNRFQPWIGARRVRRILDIGTGSGAIALACAQAFKWAAVDAVDISSGALQVCRRNVRRLGLENRVQVLKSDTFSGVSGRRYDIIVSNPPYVGRTEMRGLPREYRFEPRLGLVSGADGLDAARAIIEGARRHLQAGGILVVEVGNSEHSLLRAFPRLPFVWPQIAMGGGGIFILNARDLALEQD